MDAEKNSKINVAVIGAGLAGLTTAHRLKQQGFRVSVYEARARPGGRVYSFYSGNSHDELGGKFLTDGGDATNIRALAQEFKLEVEDITLEYTRSYYADGKSHSYYELFKDLPIPKDNTWASLEGMARQKSNLAEVLDAFFAKKKELRNIFEIHLRNYEGPATCNLTVNDIDDLWTFYKIAYFNHLAELEGKTNTYLIQIIKGGNCRLIEKLCHSLNGAISYEMPLTKISKHDQQIRLEFNNSTSINTDIVVLAIPCSTLRDVTIDQGIFPDDQLHAINSLQYGGNAKLLIPIDLHSNKFPECAFTEDCYIWFNTDHSIATCYYGGEVGKFDDKNNATLKSKLEKEARALHALYPYATFSDEIKPFSESKNPYIHSETPIGISWSNEKYSKGSYSYFGHDYWNVFNVLRREYGDNMREVFRPINKQIFFAGEHTALYHTATLEGAVESGERTARIIGRATKSE